MQHLHNLWLLFLWKHVLQLSQASPRQVSLYVIFFYFIVFCLTIIKCFTLNPAFFCKKNYARATICPLVLIGICLTLIELADFFLVGSHSSSQNTRSAVVDLLSGSVCQNWIHFATLLVKDFLWHSNFLLLNFSYLQALFPSAVDPFD